MPSVGNFPSFAALSAELPARFVPYGYQATCLDVGTVYSNGVGWWPVGSGGGGTTPVFSNSVTATLLATQNNYPLASGVNRVKATAAVGGTSVTGLQAANVPDGWTVYWRNYSTTDVTNFQHLSGSSSAANQFSCPQGVYLTLAPLTGLFLIYDLANLVWTFA